MRVPDRIAARFAAFSLIGVINTAIGITVILAMGALGMGAILANFIGYAAGLAASFALNSRVTFRGRSRELRTLARFLAAFAGAFVVNLIAVRIATGLLPDHRLAASLAGTPLYMVLFYALCECWVFRGRDAGR